MNQVGGRYGETVIFCMGAINTEAGRTRDGGQVRKGNSKTEQRVLPWLGQRTFMEYHKTSRTWLIRDQIISIFVLLGKSAKGTVAIRMYIMGINLSGLLMIHDVSIMEFWRCREEKGGRKRKVRYGSGFKVFKIIMLIVLQGRHLTCLNISF